MNPFQGLQQFQNAMKNPMGMFQQQALQRMQKQDPNRFNQIMNMVRGKGDSQLKEMAENIAKERGVDLNQFASQFNIKL